MSKRRAPRPTATIPVPRTPRWVHDGPGSWEDYLAMSVARHPNGQPKATLAVGTFGVGPRGGREVRYPIRRGIDEQGIAKGGCDLARDIEDATASFLRACEAAS